jgi:hypothetical protein
MNPRSWSGKRFAGTPRTARRAPARYRPRQARLAPEELERRDLPSATIASCLLCVAFSSGGA